MQKWEQYQRKPEDQDRCHICGSDKDLTGFDGWGYGPEPLDETGTVVLHCDACQAWAYRTALLAGYVAEDGL